MEEEQDKNLFVMYLIVKKSLNMSIGKTAAQCAHAVEKLTSIYYEANSNIGLMISDEQLSIWRKCSTKIVLKATDKEFEKIKEEYKNYLVLVKDAGRTEIPSGSETVIGLFPQHKSMVTKTIKRLQLL